MNDAILHPRNESFPFRSFLLQSWTYISRTSRTFFQSIYLMSDHWNGIANLLGTPSLNPQKKSDSTEKPQKLQEKAVEIERPSEPAAEPKPSRIRSSWDAVAQFFGVTGAESLANTAPISDEPVHAPKQMSTKATHRKSKPSMWGPSDSEPIEPDTDVTPESRNTKEPDLGDTSEPVVSSAPARKNRDRSGDRIESRGNRESRESRERPSRESDTDLGRPAERRSVRRPPRRGQQIAEDEVRIEAQESRDSKSYSNESSSYSDSSEEKRHSGDRKRLPEDRHNRRVRGESKPSRESVDSESIDRADEARVHRDRDRDKDRDRGRRDKKPRDTERSAPSSPRGHKPVKETQSWDDIFDVPVPTPRGRSSEFGAGIHEDDPFSDYEDSRPNTPSFYDDSDEDAKDADPPRSESQTKNRRRRSKRSNEGQSKTESSSAGRESRDDQGSEEVSRRNAKIPSWHDAIGALINANVENHQRSQSAPRSTRGRGPRRDR